MEDEWKRRRKRKMNPNPEAAINEAIESLSGDDPKGKIR